MKYIMFRRELREGLVQLVPIIFPDELVHLDVAKAIESVPGMERARPIRAGTYSPMAVETSGRSETLNLDSAKEDVHTIVMFDYLHGYET